MNYCVPPYLSLVTSNCPGGLIHVEEFCESNDACQWFQFMEILTHQNGLNWPSVVNFLFILYWSFWGHAIGGIITCDSYSTTESLSDLKKKTVNST